MSVPTYDQFIEPILRYLAQHPKGVLARDAQEEAANALALTSEDRMQLIPSGQVTYKNRCGWAHDRLKRAGFSKSLERGLWQLTPEGLQFALANSAPLQGSVLEALANKAKGVKLGPPYLSPEVVEIPTVPELVASPDDRLESALKEIRQNVEANLLERLLQVSPTYFETIVLELLHRMGYGAKRSDLQRVGGVSDGGIDGVISLDKLGLEKVYVQAKRWQGSVGRPEVQGFYGALAGQRANKGVFITTSTFTLQAQQFAQSVERIVLVDGIRLAELMVEHEVGVTLRPVKVPMMDSDFFEN